MRVVKPMRLSVLSRPYEFRREFYLGIAVIAFMPIGGVPVLLSEQALWPFLAEELPPEQALDVAIPKAQAEFLATTHAFAPGGAPVGSLRVGVQCGPVIKTLNVFGDRYLMGDDATPPQPFTTMPVDWAHAYGGPRVAGNPLGKGAAPVETAAGPLVPAPNVVDPRRGYRDPAGFGAVDQTWPDRARRVGTHDATWLKEDFPGFARDIDWTFFNVAPPDQRLPQGFTGSESYAFENLHPGRPLLKGQLPGLCPRAFVTRRTDDTPEEVALKLTTAWFFPHRERLVLVHHGRVTVTEEDASDIAVLMAAGEAPSAPRAFEDYAAVLAERLDPSRAGKAALRDEDLLPAGWIVLPEPGPLDRLEGLILERLVRSRRAADEQRRATIADVRARGADPERYGSLEPPPPRPAPAGPAELDALRKELAEQAEAFEAKLRSDVAARVASAVPGAAADAAARIDAARTKPKGPPPFSAAAKQAELAAQAARLQALGIVPPRGLAVPNPDVVARWQRAEADARRLYRKGAHHQAPADPVTPERSAWLKTLLADDPDAARSLYDMHGATLTWLDLAGLDLTAVCLDGADLTGTSLAEAVLADAVLAHANLTSAVLDGANLAGANLGGATMHRTSLRGALLTKAFLDRADLTGASLRGADLTGASLSGAVFTDVDLTNAKAPGVLAMNLHLRGLRGEGILLDKAQFLDCDLRDASLDGASLRKTVFLRCRLDGARLRKADLTGAVFVEGCRLDRADLTGAELSQANLRGTFLPNARLDGAGMEGTDFSEADLQGASLRGVRAIGARFVAALLGRAVLEGANLMHADLARADLRAADLTRAGAYGANMARVRLDAATKVANMGTVQLRYHPRYQAAQA